MPPVKGQMFRYSVEDMEKAIEEVLRGHAVSTTAKKYGIPRVTLLYKSRGKTPRQRKMGPTPYLNTDQESILAKWIIDIAKAGFPVQKEQLMSSVQNLMTELNQQNVFKDNKPGRTWLTGFLRRNPEISIRTAQNLTSTRAAVKKEAILQWFSEVYSYLEANNYEDILNEPTRVFNSDETAFFLNPKGSKVLAAKGDKNIYQQVNPDEKECLTVLFTGNAAGQVAPPAVIFKYERIPRELALSVPDKWGIGKSESGWMTGETFYEYITNIFDKWLTEMNITRPVILFIDGHVSHLTLHTSRFCDENGIILVALYPNATHILQPMDVAVFHSLKTAWKNAVHQWRINHADSPILRKVHFCSLLEKVINEKIAPSILISGFRKCGLVPWNAEVITFSNQQINNQEKEKQLQELKNGIAFLEKYIDKEKIAAFKINEVWNDDIQDVSLFNFYKNIEKQIKTCEAMKSTRPNMEHVNICTLNDSVIDIGMQSIIEDPDAQSAIEELGPLSPTQETGPPSTTQGARLSFTTQENTFSLTIQEPSTSSATEKLSEAGLPVLNREVVNTNNINDSDIDLDSLREFYVTPIKHSYDNTITQDLNIPLVTAETSAIPQVQVRQALSDLVPSPFKRVLFWPGPKKQTAKKRKIEKIPAVVTSKQWQSYHESKESKKIMLLEEKKKRAEERQKKKEIADTLKKLKQEKQLKSKITVKKQKYTKKEQNSSKSSDDETWKESGSSIDDLSSECSDKCEFEDNTILEDTFNQDDYVLVKFPGKKREHKFACIIQRLLKNKETEVIALNYCDGNKSVFKTNDKDVSVIKYGQIISKLPIPKMVLSGERLRYLFESALEVDG